jgi:hypothetical protein
VIKEIPKVMEVQLWVQMQHLSRSMRFCIQFTPQVRTVFQDEANLQLDHLPSTEESQHQVQEIVKNVQKVDWTGGTESIGDHEGLTVREGGRFG